MSDESLPGKGRRSTDTAAKDQPASAAMKPHGMVAFEAQLLTQGTIKRGLRGGKEVLDAARTSYLKTEWSGPADRRPHEGQLTKTKI